MIVDCVSDLFAAGAIAIFKAPEDKKAELLAKYQNETLPKGLELLEKLLKQSGSKFFVGNCVTWADIVVANFCDGVMMKGGDAIFGRNGLKQDLLLTYKFKIKISQLYQKPNFGFLSKR